MQQRLMGPNCIRDPNAMREKSSQIRTEESNCNDENEMVPGAITTAAEACRELCKYRKS